MSALSVSVRATLAAVVLGLLGLAPAEAAAPLESNVFKDENIEARLVSETSAVAPGRTFLAALHFKIRDGWHTYWRFAGDSGAPTTIGWTLPPGFTASGIIWPMPIKVPLGPLMDYGYEGEAFHLVSITAPRDLIPGTTAKLDADAEWLVCSDEVCIPGFGKFVLELPVIAAGQSPRPDPVWGEQVTAAALALPIAAPFDTTVKVTGAKLRLSLRDARLAHELKSREIGDIGYFPYADGIIRHPSPQDLSLASEGIGLTSEASYLATSGRLPNPLTGLIVVTRKDGARQGFEISASPGEPIAALAPLGAQGEMAGTISALGLAGALLFAFLGGIILNLMPCVFPILSMKALAFARRAPEDKASLRLHGWLYTLGILTSFLTLAGVLFALRGSGAAIGWGYQLQSPVVVLLLAYLMFVVGLGLSGVITIGAGLGGIGNSLVSRSGAAGTFFTGVLATVVAAPCTAPFMSAALGFAMLAPALIGFSVFVALGLGLALPFLIISHAPGVLGVLPKPGPWMERLKEFLAFPMYGAAAWLVWVLAQQTGAQNLLAALGGLVLIGFAAWITKAFAGERHRLARIAAIVVAIVSSVGFAAFAGHGEKGRPLSSDEERSALWTGFTPAVLNDAIERGRPIFVDATAAWCLTCKVNELGALSSRRVLEAFEARNVLLLRADWTNRDKAITDLLTRHGRLGVPLYLYYPSGGGGSAKILPQILTEESVLAALND